MKTFLIAGGFALATLSAPQIAVAQNQSSAYQPALTGEHKKAWDAGHKLETEGRKSLQSADREMTKQSNAVVNAQNLRDTSQQRAENARAAFESLTARPFFSSPKEALSWAKQVESAASDWAKNDARRDDGIKDLERAQSRQAKAQKAHDKAQTKIDKGQAMKFAAEQASKSPGSR